MPTRLSADLSVVNPGLDDVAFFGRQVLYVVFFGFRHLEGTPNDLPRKNLRNS